MLLIALGNPGQKYQNTRHNAGQIVLSSLEPIEDVEYLALEDTFMNQSGPAVLRLLKKHNCTPDDLVLMHDDWAFEVGEYRIQKNRSANRHNGVLSVINSLGTQDFWRVRIGIGETPVRAESSDHVLSTFTKSELQVLADLSVELRFEIPKVIQ